MRATSRGTTMLEDATPWLRRFQRTKAYDLIAASPLIAWYLYGLRAQAPLTGLRVNALMTGEISLLASLQLLALIGSFALSFVLILLLVERKIPELKSKGLLPRLVAVCGTFLGNGIIHLTAVELPLVVQALADVLIIAGTAGALVAVSRLGESFSVMPEARKLVTSGPYALVRHPLYAAELVGVAGLVLQFQQPWAVLLGMSVFAFQYWRTVFEESVLSQAYPDYAAYRARTWRFVPYLF
jgi:protein-S-isoprenylcysteine O-methyltransferase Ste14